MSATVQDQSAADDVPATMRLRVGGMHCAACAARVESSLRQDPQVRDVHVDAATGMASITCARDLELATLQAAVAADGYTLSPVDATPPTDGGGAPLVSREVVEIAAAFVVLAGVVLTLKHVALLPSGLAISDTVSLGLAFGIGLVASVSSCIAVTGGLLVAVSARFSASSSTLTPLQRLNPHLFFNAGRLVSYALLGAAIGALGSALSLSPAINGVLTLLASAVMIVLGLQMLGVLVALRRIVPPTPRLPLPNLTSLLDGRARLAAFLTGGLTFFLPCGFTQALQLHVLATGDPVAGALTMLAFALGTLPALLSLSALSSLVEGAWRRRFVRFAGAAVIVLGVMNIQAGWVLSGIGFQTTAVGRTSVVGPEAQPPASGTQTIAMRVVGLDYQPHQFTVTAGVPVAWTIDASEAEGCGRVLVSPKLGVNKLLSSSSATVIRFTAAEPGDYAFNCGMGMMTPGSRITVRPKETP